MHHYLTSLSLGWRHCIYRCSLLTTILPVFLLHYPTTALLISGLVQCRSLKEPTVCLQPLRASGEESPSLCWAHVWDLHHFAPISGSQSLKKNRTKRQKRNFFRYSALKRDNSTAKKHECLSTRVLLSYLCHTYSETAIWGCYVWSSVPCTTLGILLILAFHYNS